MVGTDRRLHAGHLGVLGPLFGRLADRFGRKLMLIRSLAGFVVIMAIMGVVKSVEQLFLVRADHGPLRRVHADGHGAGQRLGAA